MPASLPEGANLAHYRILGRIGSGGMGEVYRAHDTTLERDIALKILPPELVAREDRVQRFVQEAKAASSLSHPNIITIHEIGEASVEWDEKPEEEDTTVHYIAMELVDGETLRRMIYADRRDIPKLLDILAQAADGLAKAHAAGIVHRDLKPDNVMITKDGFAKVLDFGLAKLTEKVSTDDAEIDAPTALREQTKEGAILGTVGYMAPEQVEGRQVDHRADVFAFGCILYEVLSKKKPFSAKSDVDVLHQILHDDPESIGDVAPEVPGELRRIVRHCMAKDPERRYQSIKDIGIELRDLAQEYDQLTPGSGSRSISDMHIVRPAPNKLPWILAAAFGIVAIVIGFAALRDRSAPMPEVATTPQPASPSVSMSIQRVTSHANATDAAISPDGRLIAYSRLDKGRNSIRLRQTETGSEVEIVPPADLDGIDLTFTRDGNYLYLRTSARGSPESRISVIPSLGGTPRTILEGVVTGITLSPDEERMAFIRFVPGDEEFKLIVAKTDGTDEEVIARRSGQEYFRIQTPSWSPDGKWIAAPAGSSEGGLHDTILVASSDGAESRSLVEKSWFFFGRLAWLPDGTGIVAVGQEVESPINQIWLVSFPEGELRRITNDLNNYFVVSLTAEGRSLVTVQSEYLDRLWKISEGSSTPLTSAGDRFAPGTFSIGTDGGIVYQSMESGNLDVWILNEDGEKHALTSHPRADYAVVADPDRKRIFFQTERSGSAEFWTMHDDGTGQRAVGSIGRDVFADISPGGKWLVFSYDNVLWRLSTKGGEPEHLADYGVTQPKYSPDGQWIAGFFSLGGPSDPRDLAVLPAEGGTARKIAEVPATAVRVITRWTSDGRSVGYLIEDEGVQQIWIQPIDGGPARQVTNFDSGYIDGFQWSPDGDLYVSRGRYSGDVVMFRDFR